MRKTRSPARGTLRSCKLIVLCSLGPLLRLVPHETFEPSPAAFGLAGALSGDMLANEVLRLCDILLLRFPRADAFLVSLAALRDVAAVGRAVGLDRAERDLPRVRSDAVEKVPVVRDDKEGSAERAKERLEPLDGLRRRGDWSARPA